MTHPWKASCSAKPPPLPAWRASEGPEGLAAAPVGGGTWLDNEPTRRSKRVVRTAEAGGTHTTASQISHVIYRGHFSRCPKNVGIPGL